MRKLISTILALAMAAAAQVRIPGPGGSTPTATYTGPVYTGQNCVGGGTIGTATVACSTSLTVNAGDEIGVYGTLGDSGQTLTSCSSAAGATATVTWTKIAAASDIHDLTNNETEALCVGNVTNGGAVKPQMNWSSNGTDEGILAAAYSGSSNATDTGIGQVNAGSSSANANTPGTITTTVNNDLLFGGVADTAGTGATISAGTTSVTFTKRVCTTLWGGQSCIEDGGQTTAGAGTTAAWSFSNADRNLAGMVAIKK